MTDKKTDSPPEKFQDENSEVAARDVKPAIAKAVAPGAPSSPQAGDDTSTYEEYLFGRGTLAAGAKNQAWSDTTKGRVLIRLFSRGIVGAAAFALGGRYANKHLKDYELTPGSWKKDEPLQWIAKGFDVVFGKPIAFAAKSLAPKGKGDEWVRSATRFRTKAYFYNKSEGLPVGRSLGAEMVAISFDFASASVGDATARNIIQAFDPNIQKPWIVDGKFDFDKWAKSTVRAGWRVLTKNAGEDWGAALPYVYQMKWQRQAFAKLFPGSKLMFDYGWNGGSLKVDHAGKVIGDYQLAGALDLQCRFVGYNWYTLMYRDAYDAIGRNLKDWKKNHYKIVIDPGTNPIESTLGGIGNTMRYVAKSFIKANLYMQPAVPFFWAFRTPQTKWRASPICAKHESGYGILTEKSIVNPEMRNIPPFDPSKPFNDPTPAAVRRFDSSAGRIFQWGEHTNKITEGTTAYFGNHPVVASDYNPFALKNQKTVFGALLNPLGWMSYTAGTGLTKLADKFWDFNSLSSKFLIGDRQGLSGQKLYREMTIRSFADAAFSYTPYMIAKAEFGLRVDDRPAGGGLGEMDKAIYGAMDSLGTLKFNQFGKYINRIGYLLTDDIRSDVISREGSEVKKEKTIGDGSVIPEMTKDPSTRIEKSSVVAEHKQAFSHAPKDQQSWKEFIADKREEAQLHPSHPTVQ